MGSCLSFTRLQSDPAADEILDFVELVFYTPHSVPIMDSGIPSFRRGRCGARGRTRTSLLLPPVIRSLEGENVIDVAHGIFANGAIGIGAL